LADKYQRFGLNAPDLVRQTKPLGDFIILFEGIEAFNFFLQVQTYWLHGFNGITGLDHAAVISRIALFVDNRTDQQWLLQCVEAIEAGVLQACADRTAEEDDQKQGEQRIALTDPQKQAIAARKSRRC